MIYKDMKDYNGVKLMMMSVDPRHRLSKPVTPISHARCKSACFHTAKKPIFLEYNKDLGSTFRGKHNNSSNNKSLVDRYQEELDRSKNASLHGLAQRTMDTTAAQEIRILNLSVRRKEDYERPKKKAMSTTVFAKFQSTMEKAERNKEVLEEQTTLMRIWLNRSKDELSDLGQKNDQLRDGLTSLQAEIAQTAERRSRLNKELDRTGQEYALLEQEMKELADQMGNTKAGIVRENFNIRELKRAIIDSRKNLAQQTELRDELKKINEDCVGHIQKLAKERGMWQSRVSAAQNNVKAGMEQLKAVTQGYALSQKLNTSGQMKKL